MIINGSMRYAASGRKKNNQSLYQNKRKVQYMQLHANDKPVIRETPDYPSAPLTPYKPQPSQDWKVEASSEYTIAPAYNKGAYQVISKDNIEDIGK
jgi:hypothetical protein|tara:strand:+ start:1419 stop:1706 length:288 start_codon:yes stop_codon:yes gene_type:complete